MTEYGEMGEFATGFGLPDELADPFFEEEHEIAEGQDWCLAESDDEIKVWMKGAGR